MKTKTKLSALDLNVAKEFAKTDMTLSDAAKRLEVTPNRAYTILTNALATLYVELDDQLTAEISAHASTHGKLHRLRKHINDLSPFRKLLAGVNPAHPDLTDKPTQ